MAENLSNHNSKFFNTLGNLSFIVYMKYTLKGSKWYVRIQLEKLHAQET